MLTYTQLTYMRLYGSWSAFHCGLNLLKSNYAHHMALVHWCIYRFHLVLINPSQPRLLVPFNLGYGKDDGLAPMRDNFVQYRFTAILWAQMNERGAWASNRLGRG